MTDEVSSYLLFLRDYKNEEYTSRAVIEDELPGLGHELEIRDNGKRLTYVIDRILHSIDMNIPNVREMTEDSGPIKRKIVPNDFDPIVFASRKVD